MAFILSLSSVGGLAYPGSALAVLSASTSDFAMEAVSYSHADQLTGGTITLTAKDTGREACVLLLCTTVNDGWNVTLHASDFTYSGSHAGTPIPAANLLLAVAHPPTRTSGQAISATGGPRTTNVTGALDATRKTLHADGPSGGLTPTFYGIGTYQQALDLTLTIPGGSRAGSYATTLTVTIAAGP